MEVELLIPIFALLIPIVAILAGAVFKPWLEHQRRRLELETQLAREQAGIQSAQTERLEQRVRVLERIVTDRGLALNAEIEQLRLQRSPADEARVL